MPHNISLFYHLTMCRVNPIIVQSVTEGLIYCGMFLIISVKLHVIKDRLQQ